MNSPAPDDHATWKAIIPGKSPWPVYLIGGVLILLFPFVSIELDRSETTAWVSPLFTYALKAIFFLCGYGVLLRSGRGSIGAFALYALLFIVQILVLVTTLPTITPTTEALIGVSTLGLSAVLCFAAARYLWRHRARLQRHDA